MGISHKNHRLEPVAQLEPNFDGIVIEWSSSKIVSDSRALPPRWSPQCSSVVIESSFDPGERLQAPGSLCFFYSLPVKTSPISACCRIVHSWYTNTPITGVKKKRCSRLFLLRLINIDNYAFSIFKPSSNLFVLKK